MASFSSIVRGLSCKRKAILATALRKFQPKNDNLIFGSAYHTAVEFGIDKGIEALKEAGLSDMKPLLIEMVTRLNNFMSINEIEMLDNEMEFAMNVDGTDEKFIGFIDGLALWRGKQWLIEFKTARSIDVDCVPVDSQITAYLYACRELGLCEPEGVLYIVNQKSVNKPPVVLANGHLSVAKNQGCTLTDYLDKVQELYGESIPPKVELFIEWLAENEKPLLVSVATKRSQAQLDRFGDMLKKYVIEEGNLKKAIEQNGIDAVLRETPCFANKMCMAGCDYSDVCKALLIDEQIDIGGIDSDEAYRELIG